MPEGTCDGDGQEDTACNQSRSMYRGLAQYKTLRITFMITTKHCGGYDDGTGDGDGDSNTP